MDETTQPEASKPVPEIFNWHIMTEELLAMSEEERAVYLNEKTSRLYEALTVISRAGGETVSQQDIEIILNPEEVEDRQKSSGEIDPIE